MVSLTIAGSWRQGALIAGDGERPIVQVKWFRPRSKRFNAQRWIRRRMKQSDGQTVPAEAEAAGFSVAGWVTRKKPTGSAPRRVWCGYAPGADLALEVLVNLGPETKHRANVGRRIVSSLRVSADDAPTPWAVFDASFISPPEFIYSRSRLNLGDIVLCLTAGGGRRLILRQVYPAGLALSRRALEKWLDDSPFPEHRKRRPFGQPQPWSVRCFGRTLKGVLRTGRKSLPMPLGFIASRSMAAAAVVDEQLDRLLLVEYDAASEADEQTVARMIGRMNWAKFEAEGPS
ncbi:hypothetical protein LCGC14_1870580 [marine sediment metagenome]|uniref:Uncharacterized protein n=1 Tax=marine sediment metagenome TaxID=412755 RepID=A0A0F9J3Y7_9ZZZZ